MGLDLYYCSGKGSVKISFKSLGKVYNSLETFDIYDINLDTIDTFTHRGKRHYFVVLLKILYQLSLKYILHPVGTSMNSVCFKLHFIMVVYEKYYNLVRIDWYAQKHTEFIEVPARCSRIYRRELFDSLFLNVHPVSWIFA